MEHEIKNALEIVRCEEDLKENTLAFLKKQREKHAKQSPFSPLRLVPALLALVLSLSGFAYQYYQTPVAYVSIDINPSIELSLNRLETVTSARAYNDDGDRILRDISLQGLRVTDAIDRLLSCDAMQIYLGSENDLTFTVAAQTPQQEEALLSAIAENPLCRQNQRIGYHGQLDCVEQAHEAGMSLGKYSAYLELSQYDSTITPEHCQKMTMAQIHACIHEQGQAETEPEPAFTDSTEPEETQQKNSTTKGIITANDICEMPELQGRDCMKKKAAADKSVCVACGACKKVCPRQAITIYRGCYAVVDEKTCVGCGLCGKTCPAGCIRLLERSEVS